MPFNLALSGLNAASADLNVTANNIANVNTHGFKKSRAEFADLFAVSMQGVSSTAVGNGVRLASVAQQFAQGNINFTDNALDLAVNGEGMFVVSAGGEKQYTRAGAFSVDREGHVVNSAGQRLQVFPPAGNNTFNQGALTDLRLSTAESAPSATTSAELAINLPASADAPASPVFDPDDPLSFNHTTSMTVYDSLGASHTATVYFAKGAADNEWITYTYIDGEAVGAGETLTFNADGRLVAPADGRITLPTFTPDNGANPLDLSFSYAETTQYGSSFGVSALRQDGYATGRLTGIDVDASGIVLARYTNGQSVPLGQVALARFDNPQGLQQLGNTNWGETFASGQPVLGVAGSSNFGAVQSGALEASNVDLTEQLVNMITAQRNYQANAQMISTADAITQTIINIR